ncbi:hypothetical protein ABL78_3391 [Leptomonas seymouri]|uniref:Helicase C-terminal domain-containing protein n=1 Tax=Leptomonas seymouri TaxID=5684 RepID=A0A0N1ILC3_LEPSE|nr:hypothetical protein ABL78_3391 [Leptomonas seymouri]|eukprot:KPI87513.1 hypothetical protein ABL78_3391 [Leptomonas seymouri]
MWTRWRRSSPRLQSVSHLHDALFPHAAQSSPSAAARSSTQTEPLPTSTSTLFSSTPVLLRRHEGHHTETRSSPSGPSSTAAAPASPPTRCTCDRTAELLHRIARRGGGVIQRARHDVPAPLHRSGASHGEKTASPLARLFAAPPRLHASGRDSKGGSASSRPRQRTASAPVSPTSSAQAIEANQAAAVSPEAHSAPTGRADNSSSAHVTSDRPSPPSRALLTKLLLTIQQEKRVRWDAVTCAHPEVLQMPLYASRDDWCAQMRAQGSATPLLAWSTSAPCAPPLFLCTASTGSGKSVLLPLFALDAHWAALEQRLQHTLDHYDALTQRHHGEVLHASGDDASGQAGVPSAPSKLQPFPIASQAAFVRHFTACSRLCIVVSQPTRVACAELARYVSTLLDAARRPSHVHAATRTPTRANSTSTSDAKMGTSDTEEANGDGAHRQLIGKRVGYAVGGEPRFCADTELIYATPAYVLNALQFTSPSSSTALLPTTLMVDEAHCRNIETDALLAWMKLLRGLHLKSHALRQCYVMSATMGLAAMDQYLSRPLPNQTETHGGGRGGGPETLSSPAPPTLLLSPAQVQHVQRWWGQSAQAASTAAPRCMHKERQVGARSTVDWSVQIQHDVQARRAVLLLLEATEGEAYNVGDGVAHGGGLSPLSYPCYAPPSSGRAVMNTSEGAAACSDVQTASCALPLHAQASAEADDEGHMPHGIVVSAAPHRVERFFIDDLDPECGCFEQSRVLFDSETRRAVAADQRSSSGDGTHPSTGGGGGARGRPATSFPVSSASTPRLPPHAIRHLPLCLTDEGILLRQHLMQMFGTRPSTYNMFTAQSRLLASFALEIMQAARQRWVSPSSSSAASSSSAETPAAARIHVSPSPTSAGGAEESATAPVTVLLFVAGISEMYQIMQSLERLCERVLQPPPQQPVSADSHYMHNASNTSVEVLRSGNEVFSVGLLHSSAVGSPQEQLTATAQAGAPLRLLLATNVAENSLTIPNVRVVIDTCLERRARADELTGTTRLQTAFVSPSGLRQRCGRVGRTADGIVIHMAPRHYVLPPVERLKEGVRLHGHDLENSDALALGPLEDGVVTVLLRMKYLFTGAATALAALPSPPRANEVQVALQQLVDMELLALPAVIPAQKASGGEGSAAGCAQDAGGPSLEDLLHHSTFTKKGLLVAALPLPFEHAALVYHALQFFCVEDAVLVACAMTVPALFTVPRITAHSMIRVAARKWSDSDFTWSHTAAEAKPALSPLENFFRRLCVQRDLAGFSCPGSPAQEGSRAESKGGGPHAASNAKQETVSDCADRVGHLSEPLLLRTFLRRWYALSSVSDSISMLAHFSVHRAALRQVDIMVEQCCSRLIHLLLRQRADTAFSGSSASDKAEGGMAEEGEEQDFGSYVCNSAVSPAGGHPSIAQAHVALPFVDEWPDGMQSHLLRSLRSLQRAAHSRVHLRRSVNRYRVGLPQWHDSEERCIRLCSQPYVRNVKQRPRTRHVLPLAQQRQTTRREKLESRSDPAGGDVKARCEADEQQEEEEQQQRAVRQHPSFACWRSTQQPYPSLTTVPPPLQARVTRARSPMYRPPAPPPVIAPVAFLLGRIEDRLCAAFVAAFGHRTMRGEDGGHRFHHRRLLRNLQTLEQDSDHVCTFHVDVQPSSQLTPSDADAPAEGSRHNAHAGNVTPSSGTHSGGMQSTHAPPVPHASLASYADLEAAGVTPQVIRAALGPYLAGAGLQQLEVFQSNRLAVAARFASCGFDGLQMLPAFTRRTSVVTEREDAHRVENSVASPPDSPDGLPDNRSTRHADQGASEPTLEMGTGAVDSRSGATPEADFSVADLLKPIPLTDIRRIAPPTQQQQQRWRRPQPQPRPREGGTSGNPYVRLAPFGVSLLIAAASGSDGGSGLGGLQRIPLPVAAPAQAPLPPPAAQETSAPPTLTAQDASAALAAASQKPYTAHASVRRPADAETRHSLRFSGETSADMSVSWADICGIYSRSLRWADCASLGLEHLFPLPNPPPPSPIGAAATMSASVDSAESNRDRGCNAGQGGAGRAGIQNVFSAVAAVHAPLSSALTLSVVPPVYITRSITWKVPLPVTVPWAHPDLARTSHRRESANTDAAHRPSRRREPRASLQYCVLCQHLCRDRRQFRQHCHSRAHLDHLCRAVELELTGTELEQLYACSPSPTEQRQQEKMSSGNTRAAAQAAGRGGRGGGSGERVQRSTASSSSLSTLTSAAMPLLSLLSLDSSHHNVHRASAGASLRLLTQQLHPCVIHPLSYLNCLQWMPRRSATASSVSASAPPPADGEHAAQLHGAPAQGGGAPHGLAVLSEGDDEADRATPLAVAGSLVAAHATLGILPPPHQRMHPSASSLGGLPSTSTSLMRGERSRATLHGTGVDAELPSPATVSASTLSAQHVWVLDVSSRRGPSQARAPPPMSLLLIIAGYLAAASPQAMVALLFNVNHTHVHGVMLYGLGAWRLPEPLPMQKYVGVLEHVARGGGWPGLLIPVRDGEQASQQQRHAHEGLHWCLPAGTCRMCRSVEPLASTAPSRISDTADELRKHWPTVEATLLLTLREYLQARRNMVTLADYVERVLCKLKLSIFTASPSPPSTPVTAARLLAHFITHARGGQGIQCLLRDMGCVFITPPSALSALLSAGDARGAANIAEDSDGDDGRSRDLPRTLRHWGEEETARAPVRGDGNASAWSRRLSQRALGAEGAAVELMFTVPPVLPSVLPPADFAGRLRSFYEERHAERQGAKPGSAPRAHGGANANSLAKSNGGAAGDPKRVTWHRGASKRDDRLLF